MHVAGYSTMHVGEYSTMYVGEYNAMHVGRVQYHVCREGTVPCM